MLTVLSAPVDQVHTCSWLGPAFWVMKAILDPSAEMATAVALIGSHAFGASALGSNWT